MWTEEEVRTWVKEVLGTDMTDWQAWFMTRVVNGEVSLDEPVPRQVKEGRKFRLREWWRL